jgi:hypothetical protein
MPNGARPDLVGEATSFAVWIVSLDDEADSAYLQPPGRRRRGRRHGGSIAS